MADLIDGKDVPDIRVGDMISRQAAVSICDNAIDLWNGQLGAGALVAVRDAIKALPSADIDLSGFSDKLWKTAYERGKAEAQAEIVRCKDCMYWVAHDKRCVYLNHGFAPNMWCCHGRRTDEKENI